MEPYREDRPFISIDTETSLLDRLLNAGIPLTRALKYFRDNPEGSALETLKLAAEEVVPFYGTYRNEGDFGDYAKEAVMLGVPMPYIKHPTTGKPIPNNLKEALGNAGWLSAKNKWKNNNPHAKRLYSTPERRATWTRDGRNTRDLAQGNTLNQTLSNRVELSNPTQGPYEITNTGTDIINNGTRQRGTNQIAYDPNRDHGKVTFANGWQGDMYPAGRSLRKDDMYGPFQWEDRYTNRLNNTMNELENKYEYLINTTRPHPQRPNNFIPKDNAIEIALNQGRPDIADRIRIDDRPRISQSEEPRYASYKTGVTKYGGLETWLDYGNRIVEKELRENFAMLPEDPIIRQRFVDYYGVPDLYNDWINNKQEWDAYTAKVKRNRTARASTIRNLDRKYGRNIER